MTLLFPFTNTETPAMKSVIIHCLKELPHAYPYDERFYYPTTSSKPLPLDLDIQKLVSLCPY